LNSFVISCARAQFDLLRLALFDRVHQFQCYNIFFVAVAVAVAVVWQMTPEMQQWQRKRKEVSELTQQRQGTKVIRTCDKLLRMIGRAAVLGEK